MRSARPVEPCAATAVQPRPDDPIRGFLLPGETWPEFAREGAAVERQHARADARFVAARRDRPATGDGPRVVFLRQSGVRCAGCEEVLSSGRDQVRVRSDGEVWWLCIGCGEESGAVVDDARNVRRAG